MRSSCVLVVLLLPGLAFARPPQPGMELLSYYRAGAPERDHRGLGGWAGCDNMAVPIDVAKLGLDRAEDLPAPVLVAVPSESVSANRGLDGFALYLANGTSQTIELRAQDSALPIVCEARTESGAWVAIDERPGATCGNSYHWISLHPGRMWRLAAPAYEGAMETQVRFTLTMKDGTAIRSAEVPGRIDPKWLKRGEDTP